MCMYIYHISYIGFSILHLFVRSYFRQVQDETLRISTRAPWAVRLPTEDIVIDGHLVPGGTPIIQALGVGLSNVTVWKGGELNE